MSRLLPIPTFRAFRAFLLLLSIFTLAACGNANDEPEDVVQGFYKAAAAGDADKMMQYMAFDDLPPNQMPQAQAKAGMIAAEIQGIAKANGGLKTVTLLDSAMEKENKRVKLRLTFGNGKEQDEALLLAPSGGKFKVLPGSVVTRNSRR